MDDDNQFYDDEMFEEIKQQREIPQELFQGKKKANTTVGDIVLMQFILCVLIIIALAATNLIKPEMTNNILFEFKQHIDKPFEFKSEISNIFNQIIGSIDVKF